MKIKYSHLVLAAAMVLSATAASATSRNETLRSDTTYPSNFKETSDNRVTKNPRASNWPALPERQGGRAYSKIIYTTSGPRERNAESGRR